MASDSDKHFSTHVSRTLDCLGKSQSMVKYRVKSYREIYKQKLHALKPILSCITAGSKGEGLTAPAESDHDIMLVLPIAICADNIEDIIHKRDVTLFQTERRDTPAGYTKLKLVKCEGIFDFQEILFQDKRGNRYMSSEFFHTGLFSRKCEYDIIIEHMRSGPSLPSSDRLHNITHDKVFAFVCVCPDLLNAFITRPRRYNRPDINILNDISQMEGHVVPVGCKESETSYQEWRICFTKAELNLVQSFNDTEAKLYMLLKMISKMLKNVSGEITSYVMKNVVLWLVELYPAESFAEELLTTQLAHALLFLKKCIDVNFLPSYMIPERNLISGRLDQVQRRKLTTELSAMIHEGGRLLLRCEKLQVMMSILYREPATAEEFRWRRDTAERLSLCQTNSEQHKTALILVVLPELKELVRQRYRARRLAALYAERHRQLMS